MAVIDRDEYEQLLASKLSGELAKQKNELIKLLGDPPNMSNVPASFWENGGKSLIAVISDTLIKAYMEAAEEIIADIGIGVDWGLVNEEAARWARQYSYELVRGITDTTKRILQDAISDFYAEGLTRAQLEARLVHAFGAIRAEMIAITEATRASVEGSRAIAAELAKMGIDMIPYWLTSNDEIAQRCPICGPRHNKPIKDGFFPPAHPRCRCDVRYELPKVR